MIQIFDPSRILQTADASMLLGAGCKTRASLWFISLAADINLLPKNMNSFLEDLNFELLRNSLLSLNLIGHQSDYRRMQSIFGNKNKFSESRVWNPDSLNIADAQTKFNCSILLHQGLSAYAMYHKPKELENQRPSVKNLVLRNLSLKNLHQRIFTREPPRTQNWHTHKNRIEHFICKECHPRTPK